jgi:hypothetical protein
MKRFIRFMSCVLLVLLIASPASAQPPGPANDSHHPGTSTGPSTPPSKGADMPMMDMCRQMMMGDMMGASMMGAQVPADPKDRADMLQMRGEMMKAMGDIMMKHARRMHGTTAK